MGKIYLNPTHDEKTPLQALALNTMLFRNLLLIFAFSSMSVLPLNITTRKLGRDYLALEIEPLLGSNQGLSLSFQCHLKQKQQTDSISQSNQVRFWPNRYKSPSISEWHMPTGVTSETEQKRIDHLFWFSGSLENTQTKSSYISCRLCMHDRHDISVLTLLIMPYLYCCPLTGWALNCSTAAGTTDWESEFKNRNILNSIPSADGKFSVAVMFSHFPTVVS